MLAQAASWGAISYEQDWLVEIWLGVRGLRERPGRVRAWQEGLDAAAARHGLSLVWCMATPADFFQTLTLGRVVSIRTSGDYRYLSGNASHWVRFLYTNALARALGLLPFKDVFLTARDADGLDGDPHAEAEAMLSALSAGPVGIGDRIGRTDPAIVRRTCRADGLLVKPDLPIAALERCFRADAWFEPALLVGETISQHPAGRFGYVAAMNAWRGATTLRGRWRSRSSATRAPRRPSSSTTGAAGASSAAIRAARSPSSWLPRAGTCACSVPGFRPGSPSSATPVSTLRREIAACRACAPPKRALRSTCSARGARRSASRAARSDRSRA